LKTDGLAVADKKRPQIFQPERGAPWDIEAARTLYNIHRWGAKYFDINDAGHVVAKPLAGRGRGGGH
jgi:arginine decarboxylase-like protein